MLMLSDDSFRILVSASEERSKPELGFLISEKGRFFEVVITHKEQLQSLDGQQTEHKFLSQLGAGTGLAEMSPQERSRTSRNPTTELG